ncbi:ROK family glucokinase [Clavibacter nebraskensis]|uniref:Glucokinase n=3 Tax=Clavibacter nebraskensis TaxID=31963 RepID=A0AAI8ZIZ2_9MICO|nr:ROK family glucokinase [Clavibacter nebraskensis]KXU20428.1 glucokinase [Clavibacter nebraskensis]OAH17351.1 glucokinase [Clavibacter nebraskensis]QGV69792.1 ROK family glucokinase [Clavibacter nebraskensis]QGV72583.1 ROK family glucokinase [Clavibacter nebraskensis]UQB04054.1 ROK family glucokinase [Clavibacter nebraskensis]
MHAIGIDIGGTKIAGAVVDELGAIAAEERTPTEASSPDAIVESVVAMVGRLRAEHPDVAAVGVAAAGFIDAAQSSVYYAPNINWRNEPVREKLRGRIDVPIVIENDANAAGWAEFRYGAGRLVSDMVTLTIGTGVGGAIVADDRLFRGGFGAGAELGHMRVVPDGLPCGCGARGCIEQYGSGRALLRTADELADLGGTHGEGLAARRREVGTLTGHDVSDLIQAGDPGALLALRRLGGWLGEAAASIGAILDPQMFVIGGGVAQAGDLLLDPIREAYLAHLPARGYHPEAEFRIAELVNDAGVVGAADLARRHAAALRHGA